MPELEMETLVRELEIQMHTIGIVERGDIHRT